MPKIFVLNLCLDFLPLKGKIRTPLIVHIVSLPTFSHRFENKIKDEISILYSKAKKITICNGGKLIEKKRNSIMSQ